MWTPAKVLAYKADPLLWMRENFSIEKLHPWQTQFFSDLTKYNYFSIKSGNGVGKRQPNSLIFDTPDGPKRWGDLQVGDAVFAEDGSSTSVTNITGQGVGKIYRVTFDDGSSTLADAEHLWKINTYKRGRRGGLDRTYEESIMSTEEILAAGIWKKNGKGGKDKFLKFAIPRQGAAQFKSTSVPVHPYMLGVWLGDGTCHGGQITSEDDELINKLVALGEHVTALKKQPDKARQWGIRGLMTKLRPLGLVGKRSYERFIPASYKYNSMEVRSEVLRGILDTDGTVGKHNGSVGYLSTSERLLEDVMWLARSLGGKATRQKTKNTFYKKDGQRIDCKPGYRCTITMPHDFVPFYLTRKQALVTKVQERYLTRRIVAIDFVGYEAAQCIEIAHPSHCYLTNDFIVTHNTFSLAMVILWLMSTHPGIRIQCTAPSEPQLYQGLWAELALWLQNSHTLHQSIIWTQTKLAMRGYEATWWAVARTAQTKAGSQAAESLQGVHAENNAAVIDEASGVEEGSTAAVLGMLSTGKSKVIMAGNPVRKSGLFYESFGKLSTIFRTYTVPSNDYEKLDRTLVNPDFIEFIAGVYGIDSPAWYFKVLGEFPPDDSYAMFSPEKLEALHDPLAEDNGGPVYIGGDISDGGDCESVFTVRVGNVLLEQRAFKSLDSEANADALELMMHEYKPVRVNLDAVGVGTGVVSILRRRGYKNVYAVKGNESPVEPLYFNLRSELYFKAAQLVRNEAIKTKFRCERLKGDLAGHYQDPREDGLFAVISKAKMRKMKSIENSPDFSDSFVYSLYGDKTLVPKMRIGTGDAARILQLNEKLQKVSYTKKGSFGTSVANRGSRFDF